MSLFLQSNVNKFITHTPLPLERIDQDELVEPYRVTPSIDLEDNLNFCVFDDSLVDVNAEKLNVVLSSSGQANVDEDDDDIHIEDCDEGDDCSIDDEEEEKFD
ncbi:hypothetical protein Peur_039673 [Populus x canadensis]